MGINESERKEIAVTADAIDWQFTIAKQALDDIQVTDPGYKQARDLRVHLEKMRRDFVKTAYENKMVRKLSDTVKGKVPSDLAKAQQALIDSATRIANFMTATADYMRGTESPTRYGIEKLVDFYRTDIAKISGLQYYGAKFLSALLTLGGMVGGFFLGRLGVNAVLPDETPISTGAKVAAVAVPIVGEVVGAVVGGYVANKLADTLFKSDQQLLIEKCMKLADKQTSAHVEDDRDETAYNHLAKFGRFVTS